MLGRRIAYLVILSVCFFSYLVFQVWFSWVLLVLILLLPLFSLLLSLPAMLTVKADFQVPKEGRMGVPARTHLRMDCKFPVPPVKCKLRLQNLLTGHRYVGLPGEYLPVQHSGVLKITLTHLWICDYLGLFRKDLRPNGIYTMTVMPKPVPDGVSSAGDAGIGSGWKPKAGGFAENHELRLYRPGDDLRLLHFKMSAKTGKLIYREPVVQEQFQVCLALCLSGTPEELDRKLGRLAWLSDKLLREHIPHEIRCFSGLGEKHYPILHRQALAGAMKEMLSAPADRSDWEPEGVDADRLYLIGGGL